MQNAYRSDLCSDLLCQRRNRKRGNRSQCPPYGTGGRCYQPEICQQEHKRRYRGACQAVGGRGSTGISIEKNICREKVKRAGNLTAACYRRDIRILLFFTL